MQAENPVSTRHCWSRWAEFLRQRRLEPLACWALEAFGPLMPLGAQVLFAGSPFLRPFLEREQAETLATLLEDPLEARAFSRYLRRGDLP